MKPFATAIAVAALLFVSGAEATETFDWTGAASTGWLDPNNWTQSPGSNSYPGDLGRITDIVNIKADPNGRQPIYTAVAGARIVATIDIDANAPSTDVSLTVTGGTLTTSGLVTVKGDLDGTATATIYTSTTGNAFAPKALCFWGRSDDPNGSAIGDFDAGVTVGATGGDNNWDTWVRGYVTWDIEAVTVNVKDLVLDGTNGANLTIDGASSTLSTSSFDSNKQKLSIKGTNWSI